MENNEDSQVNENGIAAGESAAEQVGAETPAANAVGDSSSDEQFSPDDAMTERAIRAGMSLSDIRACPSRDFAERMIGAFESRGSKSGQVQKANADGDDIPAIDFSDFGEEFGYDKNLSKSMNSMKDTIEAQGRIISRLLEGKKVSPELQKKAVEARKNLIIAKPGGESRQKTRVPSDPNAAVVDELRRMYKLN